MQIEAAINSEFLEVEALCNKGLLSLSDTDEIRRRLRPQQLTDLRNTLMGEMLGARTCRQHRIDERPEVEFCLLQMPPVVVAASVKEVQSVLGEATFNSILSRTASRTLGRLIEWPLELVDFLLIEPSSAMDLAYFEYLQSRTNTTWMILPCYVDETPFSPLNAERLSSRGLAFVFPSVQLPATEVESTPQHTELEHSLLKDIAERGKILGVGTSYFPERRQYNKRALTPLESLLVTNEVGTRVWDELVAPLFRKIPTKQEQTPPEPDEDLNDQLLELKILLKRFRIAWRLYYRNYWHHILEAVIKECPLSKIDAAQSYTESTTRTLQNLLINGTVLGKLPVHKCVKRAAMNGVGEIITQEAISLAEHHVAFGWKPTIEDREELDGDHVHES